MRREWALLPVGLAERSPVNQGVVVGARVAAGIDSKLRWVNSWLGLLVFRLLVAVALDVAGLLAFEAAALLHQASDVTGLESGDAIAGATRGASR